MLGLGALTLVGAVAMYTEPRYVGAVVLMVPLFLASLTLAPRRIRVIVVLVLATLFVESVAEFIEYARLETPAGEPFILRRRLISSAVIVFLSVIMLVVAYRRERLGVAGLRGDAMLLDLQERINRQGVVPVLPDGWWGCTGRSPRPRCASRCSWPEAREAARNARPEPSSPLESLWW